jgi:hypothetical protein
VVTGAVAARVFEKPGNYFVAVNATYLTNTVINGIVPNTVNTTKSSIQVAVQDPNVVSAGTNTVCIGSRTVTGGLKVRAP